MGEEKRVLRPANCCANAEHMDKTAVLNPKADDAAKQENSHNLFDPRPPDILAPLPRQGGQLDPF
jgi:hypothetical protein